MSQGFCGFCFCLDCGCCGEGAGCVEGPGPRVRCVLFCLQKRIKQFDSIKNKSALSFCRLQKLINLVGVSPDTAPVLYVCYYGLS